MTSERYERRLRAVRVRATVVAVLAIAVALIAAAVGLVVGLRTELSDDVRDAWTAYRDSDAVPKLLERQMTRDLGTLGEAVGAKDEEEMPDAALRVAQNASDLRLRYEPVRTVDLERFALWARQLGIDAAAGDEGAVAGDVTSLELVWERLKGETPKAAADAVTAGLREAREAADRKDMAAAGQLAPSLAEAASSSGSAAGAEVQR